MIPENTADIQGTAYLVKGGNLFGAGEKPALVSNFYVTIASQKVLKDGDEVKDRIFDLIVHMKTAAIPLRVSERDFLGTGLHRKVMEVAGAEAILYGSAKDLQLAAQELSPKPIPEREIYTSVGFQPDGTYLSKGVLISGKEIVRPTDKEIDLSGSTHAQDLGLRLVTKEEVVRVAKHLVNYFLKLKLPKVMLPLIGHTVLAAFSSLITPITSCGKPALHLQGISGSGKTFLAILATRFYRNNDRFASWNWTANALEVEGHSFRDNLFLIDDYKTSVIEPQAVIRVIQKHADGRGRSRLKPTGERQGEQYIRGLILSTGEDFVSNVESILGRTIVIEVEKEKDEEAGRACWANRHDYTTFLPYLIQLTISDPAWREDFKSSVEAAAEKFKKETFSLPNGLRISLNWALNAWAFRQFVRTLADLKVLNKEGVTAMMAEYKKAVVEHLREQSSNIVNQSPAMLMFQVLGEKLATGTVSIDGLPQQIQGRRGKLAGKVKLESVYLFPNATIEILASHFRARGERMPFTAKTLRDALADGGYIQKGEKRWTTQLRVSGVRQQAWEFSRKAFEEKCGLEQVEEEAGR